MKGRIQESNDHLLNRYKRALLLQLPNVTIFLVTPNDKSLPRKIIWSGSEQEAWEHIHIPSAQAGDAVSGGIKAQINAAG